ncbi:histidine phosphatase family protein [Microlunatus ginsengisoli]|jgi:2,3-bisphosphoglycerate-dependent phosphoglycerate mutase|uniref:Histidine phosphatase family protein n=1 Tax=Microlunatus ginsengisoli TaxID=363863 RepID=A0ABP6ZDP6_9ACTN
MTTVVLIRHGRTGANTAGVLAGRTPGVELDEVGRRQVADLGLRLSDVPLVAVVSSPLRRCRQTANAVVLAHGTPLEVHPERNLTECGYGDWTGRKLAELGKEKLWSTVQTQPSAVRFPNGEAMSEMATRATTAVRAWDARLSAEHGPHAVWAAVSHGDVIKAILADALGMHLDAFQRILVDPASVSIVRYTDSRPYVVTTNSTNADLGKLLAPPPKKPRGRRKPTDDQAAVGGGLGAADQLPAQQS